MNQYRSSMCHLFVANFLGGEILFPLISIIDIKGTMGLLGNIAKSWSTHTHSVREVFTRINNYESTKKELRRGKELVLDSIMLRHMWNYSICNRGLSFSLLEFQTYLHLHLQTNCNMLRVIFWYPDFVALRAFKSFQPLKLILTFTDKVQTRNVFNEGKLGHIIIP